MQLKDRKVHSLWLIVIAILIVAFAVFFIFKLEKAKPAGSSDMGRLQLAGATLIARNAPWEISQRPPLYSLFLTFIGKASGTDFSQDGPFGGDMGDIRTFPIAKELLGEKYLKTVLWGQAALWLGTISFLLLSLKILKLPGIQSFFFALFLLLPSLLHITAFIHDPAFSQFLVAGGCFFFFLAASRNFSTAPVVLSGLLLGFSALSRATFQLLSPSIVFLLIVPVFFQFGRKSAFKFAAIFLLTWLGIVGSWSIHNHYKLGFLGISNGAAVALSTKTAYFMERAENKFPEYVPDLIVLRDKTMADSPSHAANLWGGPALHYFITRHKMSFSDSAKILTRINLEAIKKSPASYFYETCKSIVSFNLAFVPKSRTPAVLLSCFAEQLVIFAFLFLTAAWTCFHLIFRQSPFVKNYAWIHEDMLILFVQGIYWYTCLISSAVDLGKSVQRMPVEFTLPLAIALISSRFGLLGRFSAGSGKLAD